MAEPSTVGNVPASTFSQEVAGSGIRGKVQTPLGIDVPKIDSLVTAINSLSEALKRLQTAMGTLATSEASKKLVARYNEVADGASKAASAANNLSASTRKAGTVSAGPTSTVWGSQPATAAKDLVRIAPPATTGAAASSSPSAPGMAAPGGSSGGSAPPRNPSMGSVQGIVPPSGSGQGTADGGMFSNNLMSIGTILTGVATGGMSVLGKIASGGIEYAYNRINGQQGNMNLMLQLAQALAPNVTMMNAASGKNMTMQDMVKGLAGRMPVMGTQSDMLNTILAGQSVGSLMTGTPERNGFFESVRQMQILNPGASPTGSSRGLASFMGNVEAQQRGMFLGQGAFTMIGQGGRYKTLAEWAEGITKFLQQQRPGGDQGKGFTPEELITQNFPGSNINAWFQMMGVPQDMVDYWWQYVLMNKQNVPASRMTSELLSTMAKDNRGLNIGFERLRNVTQGTRREFLMGSGMYNLYAARESADRRFNVAMQGADAGLGQLFQGTNIGQMISLLPTPIIEKLMPFITALASSPVGLAAGAIGGVLGTGDPIGDAAGSYGFTGGNNTSHLSPDLAKRVQAMMRDNPRLRISSGYRDSVTQGKLRRNGYSLVAPAGMSKHTRGWAADIGPTSEAGWLSKNAHRYGLQTAASQGEPWHVQMAGTMPVGDNFLSGMVDKTKDIVGGAASWGVSLVSDSVSKTVSGGLDIASLIGKGLMSAFQGMVSAGHDILLKPFQMLLEKFMSNGSLNNMLDQAIAAYARLMLAPLSGLMNLGGKAPGASNEDFLSLVEQKGTVNLKLPLNEGFFPSGAGASDPNLFGDPVSLMSKSPTMSMNVASPIVFNASISVDGSAGHSDAKNVASAIADHLEAEVSRRNWLKA